MKVPFPVRGRASALSENIIPWLQRKDYSCFHDNATQDSDDAARCRRERLLLPKRLLEEPHGLTLIEFRNQYPQPVFSVGGNRRCKSVPICRLFN